MRNHVLTGGVWLVSLFAGAAALAQSGATQSEATQSEATQSGATPSARSELPSLLCASTTVVQCAAPGGCTEVARADVDVPAFMRVDFADKIVRDPRGGDADRSTIDLIHVVDGQIVLHGTDPGGPGGSDGTGWTATISEATGEMLVSAVTQGTAFIVLGNCLVED